MPVRLRVLWRRELLDRLLIEGSDPVSTPELTLRAFQLTRRTSRRQLAASLDDVVASARVRSRRYSTSPPLARRAIKLARGALAELADALREEPFVTPRGVALARRLVTDGAGPLYVEMPDGTLLRAVQEASAALAAPV
ncbi:MAG TPA: hypothetical protein VNV44_00465 [Solirubrobacteraceae bacterium]|jgi:hypothetical protein|nr:hypothetical protein [Solirubrobacteraceae bacterium]